MIDAGTSQAMRQAAGLLIEECGADAVVVCITRQRGGRTETYVRPFGNAHAVRGIVDYAYEQICAEDEEDDSRDINDNDREDEE